MIEKIKDFTFYFCIAFILVFADYLLKSFFIITFLVNNLITILVALLAINITTISIIMGKLKELSDKYKTPNSFKSTIREIKKSICEQIAYIFLALIFIILLKSTILAHIVKYWKLIVGTLVCSIFIASLYNLYDTGKAIFIIFNFEKNIDNKIKRNREEIEEREN